MTDVRPFSLQVPPSVKDPSLRRYLIYLQDALRELRERTGGSSDLGFGALSDPNANRIVFWDEIEGSPNWLEVGTGLDLAGSALSTNDSQIIHDDLSGFAPNEHIDHSAVSITAGNGLTGGGNITSTRSLAVGAGAGIIVNSNSIETNDSQIIHDALSGFVIDEHVAHSGVILTAGDGMTGGGDIASSRSFAVGAGTGITVNADDIEIDQSVVVTLTGAQTLTNKSLTSPTRTGTDSFGSRLLTTTQVSDLVDSTTTTFCTITTPSSGARGGSYSCFVRLNLVHAYGSGAGIKAVKALYVAFSVSVDFDGNAARTGVTEIYESAGVGDNTSFRNIGTVTVSLNAVSGSETQVQINADFTGSLVSVGQVDAAVELVYEGFTSISVS